MRIRNKTRGASSRLRLPLCILTLCFLALIAGAEVRAEEQSGLTVTKVSRSKVDKAMTIEGRWGTFINGKSYQQMPVDSYTGWQYTTYYDQKQRLSVARRKLPNGSWEVIHFDDYILEGNDNHNVTVLGISRGDGTIHLSFDHHGHALHYRVSKTGVASNPDEVKWDASLFSEVRDWLRRGKPETRVTYPRFVPTPQGGLLLVSRYGSTIDGEITLALYDPKEGSWGERRHITGSKGIYEFEGITSTSRNAYLNGVHYDYRTGRLHISWSWKERGRGIWRDVNYAYSDDDGRSWYDSAGRKIGDSDQLIDVHSPGITVWKVGPHQGLEIMQGQYVDNLGRPHVITSHLRDGEEPLAIAERDPARSAYYHYWRDDDGRWRRNEVFHPVGSGADSERNRPKLVSTSNSDLIAMVNNKAQIVLLAATAESEFRDWRVIHIEEGPWNGEPLPDLSRWREEGVLSIYMQKDPPNAGEPTDLYVVDFSFDRPEEKLRDSQDRK